MRPILIGTNEDPWLEDLPPRDFDFIGSKLNTQKGETSYYWKNEKIKDFAGVLACLAGFVGPGFTASQGTLMVDMESEIYAVGSIGELDDLRHGHDEAVLRYAD